MTGRRRALTPAIGVLVIAALLLGMAAGAWLAGSHSTNEMGQAGSGSATKPAPAATAPGSHSAHAPVVATEVAGATVWTCSMHPQIRMPKPGPCPLCGMDLIPLEAEAGGELDPSMLRMSEAAKTLARIVTVPVERRSVTREISMVGKVAYDETRVETIAARFPGRLDRLFVDYTGVPVKSGDHLASIYSPELRTAQQELLQSLQASAEIQGDGRFLRETTRATVEATREKLRLWGLKSDQITRIERSGKISDHLTLYAHQSGIVIEKHQSEGDYVMEGSKIYTVADLSRLWVNLDAYESDLSWIHYGQEVSFQTEAYPGTSFEGRISFIHPVLDERTRTVKVRINVENPRGRLKPGMFVRSMVHAELMGEGKVFDRDLAGKWISPMHPEVVEDEPGICRVCGMPLVASETLGFVGRADPRELPLVVPASAPLLTGKRALVYVEVPDSDAPTYQGRVITLGPRAGQYYVVKDGLREGERVVVQGNFKIDSAVQIQAGPSMMSIPSEGAEESENLQGSPFMAGLEALAAPLAEVAVRLAAGDSEAASYAFEAAIRSIEALPLDGLEGRASALAEDLRTSMAEAARLGLEAWELPEQRRALREIARVLDRAGLPPPTLTTGEEALLGRVQALAFSLSEYLATDSAPRTRDLLAASPVPDELRPSPEDSSAFVLTRWQLYLVLQPLREASDLSELRERYAVFSDLLVLLTRRFPTLEAGGEVLTCPMAFSGRGARWLQAKGPVANPYFGAAMLRCGEPFRLSPEGL